MTELFGMPMTTLMWVFTVALFLIVVLTVILAVRQPVLLRLSARNIPRRAGRSALIVLGLTLATTIITSALATGDTVALSARSQVLQSLGNTDETISSTEESDIEITGESVTVTYFDEVAFEAIRLAAQDLPEVDGVMPAILEQVGAQNLEARRTEPRVTVLGLDARFMDGFGTIRTPGGETVDLAGLQPGEVLLNDEASEDLAAAAGDRIVLYVTTGQAEVTVRDVIDYDGIGTSDAGLIMSLADAQVMFDRQGEIKHVVVSNRGDAIDGVAHTDAVIAGLQPVLEQLGLAIEPSKRDDLATADEAGALFSTVFITFGSFSIAAGILLIFLLFVMLAAERKPEMGIARAVGTERIHLVQMFMMEGVLYDLAAAAVGVLTGIGVAMIMVSLIQQAVDQFGIDLRFTVSTTSLVTAYAMGVVLTFVVVTASAWRVSLLNIVTAIRNLPEPPTRVHARAFLVWGAVFLVLGALSIWAGISTGEAAPFYVGVSLIIFSSVPLLRAIGVPDRLAFTLAGGAIVVLWLLPWRLVEQVSGELSMDLNIWVIGGLITVIGVTWLVMYNSDLVVSAALATVGRVRGLVPVLRTALSYPLTNRFRTGVTLSMFTLVVFTLVIGGTVTNAMTQAFNDDELFGGGFDIRASTVQANPAGDLAAAIENAQGIDARQIEVVADQTLVPVVARQADGTGSAGSYPLRGMSDAFFDHNRYSLAMLADGYESAEEVWQAVKSDPSLVVVDGLVVPKRDNFGFGAPVPDFMLEGMIYEDGNMQPTPIVVTDPRTGESHTVTIIGVLQEVIPDYMVGITTSHAFVDSAFPDYATPTAHLIRLAEGADAETVAENLESSFLDNGMEAVLVSELLDDLVSVNNMFNLLIQGFIGLGLIVGVAALGVVSARTVVERRQEIGVMRAIGFEQSSVQLGFLIESSMIAVAGIVVGTALGLVLAYNIIDDTSRNASWSHVEFAVPWLNLLIIYTLVLGAALITSYLPARQAARVYPAQALRYE